MTTIILFIIVAIIVVLVSGYSNIRYLMYKLLLRWKNIEDVKDIPNTTFDDMYNDIIKNNNNTTESDYDSINLSDVDTNYNINIIRKFLWSNPNESTIELAEIKDKMHILDCGCGTAKPAIYICQNIPNITIDCIVNSSKLFDIAKNNIYNAGLSKRINLYLMDYDKLENPVLSNKYDRVLFLESIGYSKNITKLLNNIHKLLKKDGKVFIKTPNFKNTVNETDLNICKSVISIWRYNFSTLPTFLNTLKNTNFKNNIKYINYSSVLTIPLFCNLKDYYSFFKFIYNNNVERKNNILIIIKNILKNSMFLLSRNNIETMINPSMIDDTINLPESSENIHLDILEKTDVIVPENITPIDSESINDVDNTEKNKI